MVKSYIDDANSPKYREPQVCQYDLSEYSLLLMALMFLSQNANITHRVRSKVLEFLESIDEVQYSDSEDITWRVVLARSIGRAVQKGVRTIPAIEHRVLEDTEWADYHSAFFETYRQDTGHAADGYILENEISDQDIDFIDSYVSTRLRFSYLWKFKDFLRETADRIDAGDMGEIEDFNDNVMTVMERLVQRSRNAKALLGQESQDFTTGDSSFEAAIRAAHAARNRPQSTVSTGMRLLNSMLGGGYEGSRVYVHFGRSGDWKSGMLCSAAFWACDPRFNSTFVTKDRTRKPCVLFITQENDMFETIERMLSFSLGSHVDLKNSDVNQIIRMMEDAFSSESCRFVFKYRQSRSINASDIASMIEDLYMQGFEVIMLVQDYIKRMKSVENFREQRHLELGAIVDEFSGLIAKRYNIPVVTGMQLNREAYTKFETAIKSGNMNALKDLGASNVGESINVYENADCVIFQGRVQATSSDALYLTMRRVKMRGRRKGSLDFFAQPFARDADGDINEMKVEEDAHLPANQCRGVRDLVDGIAREYDANAANASESGSPDNPTGGLSSEEKKAQRSGSVLSRRPLGSAPSPRNTIPENSGDAQVEEVSFTEYDMPTSVDDL